MGHWVRVVVVGEVCCTVSASVALVVASSVVCGVEGGL